MVEPYVCDDLKQRYRFFSIFAKKFESEILKKNLMETAQDFFYTPFKSNYEGKSPRFEFLANLVMFLATNFLGKFGDISSNFIIFARMKISSENHFSSITASQ